MERRHMFPDLGSDSGPATARPERVDSHPTRALRARPARTDQPGSGKTANCVPSQECAPGPAVHSHLPAAEMPARAICESKCNGSLLVSLRVILRPRLRITLRAVLRTSLRTGLRTGLGTGRWHTLRILKSPHDHPHAQSDQHHWPT